MLIDLNVTSFSLWLVILYDAFLKLEKLFLSNYTIRQDLATLYQRRVQKNLSCDGKTV